VNAVFFTWQAHKVELQQRGGGPKGKRRKGRKYEGDGKAGKKRREVPWVKRHPLG